MDEMVCGQIEKASLGTTDFTLVCQLKFDHGGGHRVPLQGNPGTVYVLSWFKSKENAD